MACRLVGAKPAWCQAIIWTNAGMSLIGTLGTNFSEVVIIIQAFSFRKMHLKVPSAKWQIFFLGFNVLSCAGKCLNVQWHNEVILWEVEAGELSAGTASMRSVVERLMEAKDWSLKGSCFISEDTHKVIWWKNTAYSNTSAQIIFCCYLLHNVANEQAPCLPLKNE